MAVYVKAEGLFACVDCVQIIANGEISADEDNGQAHAEQMAVHYGPGVTGLVNGDRDYGFCNVSCGVCGSPYSGDRAEVVELAEWPAKAV